MFWLSRRKKILHSDTLSGVIQIDRNIVTKALFRAVLELELAALRRDMIKAWENFDNESIQS